MNYRHSFHAGNHADVLKHVVMLDLQRQLQQKPSPAFFLDTHGGRGAYLLSGSEAQTTREYESGVGRLRSLSDSACRSMPDAVQDYLAALNSFSTHPDHYPGSPCLLTQRLRPNDRLAVCELHPEEANALKQNLRGQAGIAVHQRSAYEALPALVPPAERRGLVLLDPPYEQQRDEFDLIESALQKALQRWPQGIYALWYPIKQSSSLLPIMRRLAALPAKSVLDLRLLIRPDDSPLRLNGSGMLIINPPWQFAERMAPTLAWLADQLGESGASAGCVWQKEEST
ncbi:23S rRNA (adenine(2030)-N(6))-methyltransferase RlmJ [Pseudomarimonas arenosa]|uniref:Ribosomal RNA large subunit methyltransferase J n=1 Tax=Pseudomarimonas arenosa TaxID=2774145 RepID=A0AAW3ZIM6_9GAMM|nr:23S rRNA (adenine(2030)-N(6))-methyltransferase RlmJ [Pseudomarimonas arenosa]MBD8524564.1 23S rRNA (adenine(2030)-N(6))-methyltransferase RlmJ [Pseudomarimonas arenosa]